MNIKEFKLPSKIIFGESAIKELVNICRRLGKRHFLICGKNSMKKIGVLNFLKKAFKKEDLELKVFYKDRGEPTLEMVDAAQKMCKKFGADTVIGIGGGSVIDLAKATSGIANKEKSIYEYMYENIPLESEGLPFIAVPTTAGTGAEVTPNAVLISKERKFKKSFRSNFLFAKVVILDPLLTLNLDFKSTLYSVLDGIVQAIESYTSKNASEFTQPLSIESLRLLYKGLKGLLKNLSDVNSRKELLYGSVLGGIALFNARLGAVHGIAHPIGALYNIPHGLICSVLLPHVAEYNLEVCAPLYKKIAKVLGLKKDLKNKEASLWLIRKIKSLLRKFNIPQNLRDLGVNKKDFDFIAKESLTSGSLKANKKPLGYSDVIKILEKAY